MSGSQKAVVAGLLAGLGGGMVVTGEKQMDRNDKMILMEAERMHTEGLARLKNQWDQENIATEHGYRTEEVKLGQAGDLAVANLNAVNEKGLLADRLSGESTLQQEKIAGDLSIVDREIGAGKYDPSLNSSDNEGKRLKTLLDADVKMLNGLATAVEKGEIKREVAAQKRAELERSIARRQALLEGRDPDAAPATRAPAAAEAAVRKDPKLKDQFQAKYGYLPDGL